jgi:hypothetical protein
MLAVVKAVSPGVCNAQSAAPSAWVSVRDLGAKGRALILRDAMLSAGSATLNSPSASFGPTDVGRSIYLMQGGPSGGPLDTHIRTVINSHTALLSQAAVNNVTNVCATIGTDDGNVIQSALDQAAAKGGGIVFLPTGTYRISSSLSIKGSNIRLTGEGSKTVLIEPNLTKRPNLLKNVPGDQIYHLAGGWAPDRAILVGKAGATISNIEIDHLSVLSPPVPWVLSNIGQSLIMTGTDTRFRVNNFKLHDMTFSATSLYAYSNGGYLSDFAIHDNTVSDVSKAAIYLAGMPANGVVAKNQISTNFVNRISTSAAIIGKNMSGVRIEENVVAGDFELCIAGMEFPERNVTVAGNKCSLNISRGTDGIYFDHGDGITVMGNTVESAGNFGIAFRAAGGAISNVQILHNVIRQARGAAISILGRPDSAGEVRNISIKQNQISDSIIGIQMLNSKGAVICANRITGANSRKCTALSVEMPAGEKLQCRENQVTRCRPGTALCS